MEIILGIIFVAVVGAVFFSTRSKDADVDAALGKTNVAPATVPTVTEVAAAAEVVSTPAAITAPKKAAPKKPATKKAAPKKAPAKAKAPAKPRTKKA